MIWFWGLASVLPILGAIAGLETMAARRLRQKWCTAAVRAWREARPGDRIRLMRDLVDGEPRHEGRGAMLYLLGCAYLHEDRPGEAARAFGAAYHADFRIESAAMLTFASLKAAAGGADRFVEYLIQTWDEMGRPPVLLCREDQTLALCLESTTRDPPELSPVGRLAWAVGSPSQQAQIELALQATGCDWKTVLQPRPAGTQ